MDKELESITQVTTVGDLRSKLVEAEDVKVEVEAVLLERVRLRSYHIFLLYPQKYIATRCSYLESSANT